MQVGMEDHGAGAVFVSGDHELTFQDIPDLREIVPVQRMARAGRETDEPGVRLGGPVRPWVEQHLAFESVEAKRLPFPFVHMHGLEGMIARLAHSPWPADGRRRGAGAWDASGPGLGGAERIVGVGRSVRTGDRAGRGGL